MFRIILKESIQKSYIYEIKSLHASYTSGCTMCQVVCLYIINQLEDDYCMHVQYDIRFPILVSNKPTFIDKYETR